jgi:hypothetical protein
MVDKKQRLFFHGLAYDTFEIRNNSNKEHFENLFKIGTSIFLKRKTNKELTEIEKKKKKYFPSEEFNFIEKYDTYHEGAYDYICHSEIGNYRSKEVHILWFEFLGDGSINNFSDYHTISDFNSKKKISDLTKKKNPIDKDILEMRLNDECFHVGIQEELHEKYKKFLSFMKFFANNNASNLKTLADEYGLELHFKPDPYDEKINIETHISNLKNQKFCGVVEVDKNYKFINLSRPKRVLKMLCTYNPSDDFYRKNNLSNDVLLTVDSSLNNQEKFNLRNYRILFALKTLEHRILRELSYEDSESFVSYVKKNEMNSFSDEVRKRISDYDKFKKDIFYIKDLEKDLIINETSDILRFDGLILSLLESLVPNKKKKTNNYCQGYKNMDYENIFNAGMNFYGNPELKRKI